MAKLRLYSIAKVSEYTGIGIETLRAWEKRYGAPVPVRLPSGHRRYTREQLSWLLQISEALALGHRPSRVLRKSSIELTALLKAFRSETCDSATNERILDLARRFREAEIQTLLRREHDKLGDNDFLLERILPLLALVGTRWQDGNFEVRHEHFLSEIISAYLKELRQKHKVRRDAPAVILATLPGELHTLGLEVVNVFLVLHGISTQFIGANTPIEEIAQAARETDSVAVAISVSLATCGVKTERMLTELRRTLPESSRLLAGGQGAKRLRKGVRGVDYHSDLSEFVKWLKSKPLENAS